MFRLFAIQFYEIRMIIIYLTVEKTQSVDATDELTQVERTTNSILKSKNVIETNEVASSDAILDTTVQITNAAKFGSVKTFMDESKEKQIDLALKWIVEPGTLPDILGGTRQIKNISCLLDDMRFNGYLRLFDIDLSMIRMVFVELL